MLAAIAFGVMFVKGSVRINLQKFFQSDDSAIMFLVAAQLLISGLHELSESGVIAFVEARDGDYWADRQQRLVFLCDDLLRWRR